MLFNHLTFNLFKDNELILKTFAFDGWKLSNMKF